jgi:hypothetical protein
MNNEIAPVDPNLYEAFGEAATRSMAFLKFSKGDFLRGQDGEVVPIGTKFVADMPNLTTGWVRWNSGAPTERILGRVGQGWVPPRRAELGDADKAVWETDTEGRPRDPWQMSNELPLISKDGSVETFATSSRGGLNAIGELCKVYGRQMRSTPGKLPMISLNVGSYQHSNREFGRIKYPVFEIVGWVDRDKLPPASPPVAAAVIEEQRQDNAARARGRINERQAQPVPQCQPAPIDDDIDVPW